jgi:branched-chain amino acid transport system permease protein
MTRTSARPTHQARTGPRPDTEPVRRKQWLQWLGAIALLTGLLLVPRVVESTFYLHIGTIVLIYVPLVIGQNLIIGNSGQVSMGHAAFYGVGAYVTAILATTNEPPAIVVIACSAIATGLLGFVVGLPAIRISGDYLFIVTIGLNLIFLDVVIQWIDVTGGSAGIPGIPLPTFFGVELFGEADFFYLALAIAALSTLFAVAVSYSRFGSTIEAARDDPIAANASGINLTPVRVAVFVIGAALAGLSGSVFAYYIGFVGPQNFGIAQSLIIFEMAIIGGLGSVLGSIVGAALLIGLPEALRVLQDYRLGLGGLLVIILMAVRPEGLLGRVKVTTLIKK